MEITTPSLKNRSLPSGKRYCTAVLLLACGLAHAQQAETSAAVSAGPLKHGAYLAPMGSFELTTGNSQTGNGYGGIFAAGYREGFFAVEGRFLYSRLSASGANSGGNISHEGGAVEGLLYPFELAPLAHLHATDSQASQLWSDLYLVAGAGAVQSKNYPAASGRESFALTRLNAGVGNLFPVSMTRYRFAIRAEVLFQADHREQKIGPNQNTLGAFVDESAPRNFRQWVFNIGVQLPLSFTHQSPAAPAPPPAEVVPVAPAADPNAPAPSP